MKRKHINESQLRNIIGNMVLEELQRANLDEGLWNQLGAAFRGATAGTGTRMKNAANTAKTNIGGAISGAANAVGRGIKGAANAVGTAAKNAYNTTAGAVQGAYNNAAQNVNDRYKAAKGSFNAQRNTDKINKLVNLIDSLVQDGTLHGNTMMQAVNTIKRQLSGAISREKGTITAYKNELMPKQQQQ